MKIATPTAQPSRFEFIALMAMMMATNAFSVDAMLPAMSEMGQELSPDNPVRIQLVVMFYMLGMGLGTFFIGPISDARGRRPVVLTTGLIYMAGALLALFAPTLELLLAARLIQGFGAAGSRVTVLAMVRDRFAGRYMAQVTSMIITVFMVVPAVAPTIGAGFIWLAGWRLIFVAFLVFGACVTLWFLLRQPETLPVESRRPLQRKMILAGLREILSNRLVVQTIIAQSLVFGMLLTAVSSVELVYDKTLGLGHQFHLWFGAAAVTALLAPVINARVVVTLGMHRIISLTVTVQALICAVYLVALLAGWAATDELIWFFLWQITIFMTITLCMGNLNALAMEPVGHLAGLASSVIAASSTVFGALLAIPVSAQFDGTQIPMVIGIMCFVVLARVALMGRMFHQ